MTTEKDDVRAFTTEELDAVTGGAFRIPALAQQSFFASRFDWVALNPQPLPPRWLRFSF